MKWFGVEIGNGQEVPCFNIQTLGFCVDHWVWNFEKIQVGHACLGCGLQRELKVQRFLDKKSLKLRGQSGVVNVFGQNALDHSFHFALFLFSV